jgi:hypothetical protein
LPARSHGGEFGLPQLGAGPEWAEQQASEQRRLEAHYRPSEASEPVPVFLPPIIGFRIIKRVGQPFVLVMGQMRMTIVFKRQPQRQRPLADQIVDPPFAGGMAVNDFMLQAHVPGGRPRAGQHERPKGQVGPEQCNGEPHSVNYRSKNDRRPFDARRCGRKILYFH